MNLSILSTQELINYLHSGVVDSLPADIVLSILETQEQRIKELKQEAANYDSGWDDAIEECISKLENMR